MIIPDKVRNYEVSIWTLQDSFITVLKQFNLDNREKIQEPSMTLKDDGENTFSFKIPMYILENGKFVENPIWYTTQNGNIIVGMRKIKVIFEKKTYEDEEENVIFNKGQVFEFIITKVTEQHEGYSKICEVECESLAFHELGKQGYLISLTEDDFLAEHEEWAKDPGNKPEPFANIDYWVKKVLKNSNWDYLVCMDWSEEDGIIEDNNRYIKDSAYRASIDANRGINKRSKQKIYRKPYVSSWSVEDNSLIPGTVINNLDDLEKIAILNETNSNRYNLLQSIAEAFQVFCKFVYGYDDNYHIISRTVVFFNNFISESDGVLDFNYGHNTQSISREMDSNDLVTKMYIQSVNDSGLVNGAINISDSAANKSLENYLLNFDYMYNIGTISQEQYDEIPKLLAKLRTMNEEINGYNNILTKANIDLPLLEAKLKTAEDGINEANTRLGEAKKYESSITGVSEYTEDNPLQRVVIKKQNGPFYVNIGVEGVDGNTVEVYTKFSNGTVNTKIASSQFTINNDKITFNDSVTSLSAGQIIYLVFSYDPQTPYKETIKLYQNKLARDTSIEEKTQTALTTCNGIIETQKDNIDQLAKEKEKLLAKFERLMGPALREGYWQPEDSYSDYQSFKEKSTTISTNTSSNAEDGLFWDENIQEDEQDGIFEYGTDQTERYYPCILLNTTDKINEVKEYFNDLFLVYKNSIVNTGFKANQYISLKAKGEIIFLKKGNTFIPALMIMDDELIALDSLPADIRLSKIEGYNDETNIINETPLNSSFSWLSADNRKTYTTVYPRFYIKSKNFIFDSQENKVLCGNNQLKENDDYYILYDYGRSQWLITIKPLVFLNQDYSNSEYTLKYTLSTAADAIFLDAQEVMKENSIPKVSYEITPLAKDIDLVRYAYNRIGQLAHINDYELKFKNVMGYISEVNLNLDKPWEDTYVIKNYKTKFEDLFSTIVAQTEAMKKNSQLVGLATNLVDMNGNLRPDLLLNALWRIDLSQIMEKYTFSAAGIRAIEDKTALANSVAYKIINGEVGLAFPKSSTIDNVILNNEVGLKIEGLTLSGTDNHTYHTSFRVTNDNLGFFKNDGTNEVAMLYFNADSGDMALAGTIFAKNGWFGGERGWIISDGENGIKKQDDSKLTSIKTFTDASFSTSDKNVSEDFGGLLYSANGRVLFASGTDNKPPFMGFYEGNNGTNPKFIFDGSNVYLNGTITTSNGSIGNWLIDSDSIYTGIKTSEASIRLSSADFPRSINSVEITNLRLAFGTKFGVASDGTLYASGATISGTVTASLGYIGGWELGGNGFYSAPTDDNGQMSTTRHRIAHRLDPAISIAAPINAAGDNHDWGLAPFRVTQAGKLYATGADISGTITATSGKIANFFIATSSNRAATSRNDGHRYGNSLYTYGYDTEYEYEVGMKADARGSNENASNLAFYVIRKSLNATWENTPTNMFYVNHKGFLYAQSADITGKITANRGEIAGWKILSDRIESADKSAGLSPGSTTEMENWAFWAGWTSGDSAPFQVKKDGSLYATKGKLAGWKILSDRIESEDESAGLSATMTNWAFWAGYDKPTDTATFQVKKDGSLYATKGQIGGWYIGSNFIGSASTYHYSTAGLSSTEDWAFWAGWTSGNSAPFFVTQDGELHATGTSISGNITANNLYLSDGKGGTTDVAATLSRLLLQADSAEDDAADTADAKTIIITGYGSNYLKLLRSDGKKKTINFKTATDVSNAYSSGETNGKRTAIENSYLGNITLGEKQSGVSGYVYNISTTIHYSSYSNSASGSIDLSSLHTTWYNSGVSAGEGHFSLQGDRYWGYSTNGGATWNYVYSGRLYRKTS